MPSFTAAEDHILYAHDGTLDLDAALLRSLQPEQFILTQSCTVSVEQQAPAQRFDPAGNNLLTAYDPGQLVWQITARVLRDDGLADYRPGAALDRQSLAFANGPDYRLPFQFSDDGILVYERPSRPIAPGTLPVIDFTIRQVCSAGYDTASHPAATVPFVQLTDQVTTSVEISAAARNALLRAVFYGDDPFSSEPLIATLYAGDPLTTGTALTTCANAGQWYSAGFIDEPDLDYRTQARNPAVCDFSDTAPAEKIATYILYTCNGITIAAPALTAPFTIPPGHAVRAPAGFLALHLTWPLDGAMPAAALRPARNFLPLALGRPRAAVLPAGTFLVTFSSADLLTDYDAITAVPADNTKWTVTGLTAAPESITSPNPADPGGWPIGAVTVQLPTSGIYVLREYHSLPVAEAAYPAIDGTPVLNLASPPDA